MDIKVSPSPFHRSLEIPSSKSYINRLLILGALFEGDFLLENFSPCDDVMKLLSSLEKIGLAFSLEKNKLTLKGRFPECEKNEGEELLLETGEGGTTTRFLIALIARGSRPYRLRLGKQIRSRPLEPLLIQLRLLGVRVEWEGEELLIQGPLKDHPSSLEVETTQSSQFASALLLSLADREIEINYDPDSAAQTYLRLTEKLVDQVRKGKRHFILPVDFSSLAFPAALAAVRGSLVVKNCMERDYEQADSVLLDIFTSLQVPWSWEAEGLKISQAPKLKSFTQNCQNCQDLVPVLCFLAAFAEGESELRFLTQLRFKETDRIKACTDILDLFSIPWRFEEKNSSLFISGGKTIAPSVLWKSIPDHRIIMMVYLFMRSNAGGEILEAQAVSKSFPQFFEFMNS